VAPAGSVAAALVEADSTAVGLVEAGCTEAVPTAAEQADYLDSVGRERFGKTGTLFFCLDRMRLCGRQHSLLQFRGFE
jgi:hypothetical protein